MSREAVATPTAAHGGKGALEKPSAARREQMIGLLCAASSVVLFSGFTLASRLGLSSSSLNWLDLAALRFGIGGVLLLPVFLRQGLSGLTLRAAAGLVLFGGLGFAVVAYAGFALAPAAHGAALLHGTLPLFTFVILSVTPSRSGVAYRSAGVALIGGGVVLMVWDSVKGADSLQLLGDGLLLLASALWSAYGVLARRLSLAPARSAAIVAVISMCCFLPVYALLPGKALFLVAPRELLLQALIQGVLIGAVSIFVYTRAVAALGPATTALFTAAVPCLTTLAAIPLLSEQPNALGVFGVSAVTLGMILAPQRSKKLT